MKLPIEMLPDPLLLRRPVLLVRALGPLGAVAVPAAAAAAAGRPLPNGKDIIYI